MGKLDFLKKKTKTYVLSWDGVAEGKEAYVQETGLNTDASKYATWYKISDNIIDTSYRLEFLYDMMLADEITRLKDIKYLGYRLGSSSIVATIAYASVDNCMTQSMEFYANATVFPTAGWWILAGFSSTETPTIDNSIPVGTNFIKVTNEAAYNISKKGQSNHKSPFYEIRNPDYADGNYYRCLMDINSAITHDYVESSDGTHIYIGKETSVLFDNFNPLIDDSLNYLTPTAEDLIKVESLLKFGKVNAYDVADYSELLQDPYGYCDYNMSTASSNQKNLGIMRGLGNNIGPFIMMCLVEDPFSYAAIAAVRDTTKNILEFDNVNFSLADVLTTDVFEVSDSDFDKLISLGKGDELYAEFKSSDGTVLRNSKLVPKESTEANLFDYSSTLNSGVALTTQIFVSAISDTGEPTIRSNVDLLIFKSSIARSRYELLWDGVTSGKTSASYDTSGTYPIFYKISDEEYHCRMTYPSGMVFNKNGFNFIGICPDIYDENITINVYDDSFVFGSITGCGQIAYIPEDNYDSSLGSYFGPNVSYTFKEKGWYFAALNKFVGKIADVEVY